MLTHRSLTGHSKLVNSNKTCNIIELYREGEFSVQKLSIEARFLSCSMS